MNLGFWAFDSISEKFRAFLAFKTHIFSSSGFRCGPQTESVYSLSPDFSKTEFLKLIFEKATCTNAVDNKSDVPDLQALFGPSVSGIQTQEVEFYTCCNFLKRNRVPRVFLSQSVTHYRLRDPQVFLTREVT